MAQILEKDREVRLQAPSARNREYRALANKVADSDYCYLFARQVYRVDGRDVSAYAYI